MNTIEDFENAPLGATATHDDGNWAVKLSDVERGWITSWGSCLSDEQMSLCDYTLDQPAPTTAREALDLAWDLAHEVKEGQVIPEGTRFLQAHNSGLKEYTSQTNFKIRPELAPGVRTLEPLPDPEPDWLDAPAVLAWCRWDAVRREKVWSKVDECYKSTDGEIIDWADLRDVTPLYPLNEGTLNGTTAPLPKEGQDA